MTTRILRLKDVKAMTGLSRSTIYAEIAKEISSANQPDGSPISGLA